jgi:hypothetical protein
MLPVEDKQEAQVLHWRELRLKENPSNWLQMGRSIERDIF